MLATQTPDTPSEAQDFNQIKEQFARSLKALQKRYVTSDAVVTSEDSDANLLCCALEAVFIHGIKSKFIRSEARSRSRKGDRGSLPQPFFWSLLKTVTHRDVITELEKISFVSTDVGRCRAWLRLALNHGLLECYLASLFREGSKLQTHYQPSALLLNAEEREVLLSYLQGLASLTFSLSYKSSVLNEWTTTPLALAGLCPLSHLDPVALPLNGGDHPKPVCKDLWDTASQSSDILDISHQIYSSDIADTQRGCPVMSLERRSGALQGSRTALNSSNLSLDTTGSSQLSSSLSSDSLLQGQDLRSPTGEQWSSSDLDVPININISTKRLQKDSLTEFRESANCSQDSMREDSFGSSTGPDQYSETAIFSDGETQDHAAASQEFEDQLTNSPSSDSEAPPASLKLPSFDENQKMEANKVVSNQLHSDPDLLSTESELIKEVHVTGVQHGGEALQEKKEAESTSEPSVLHARRSTSIMSRTDSLSNSRSWISDDDIFKPHLEEVSDISEVTPAQTPEPQGPQSPPSVVHRRQIGLFNPFRGLLKLGHLERRNAMGLWRDHYCELSPFEFRLYQNAEERICCDNCSLVRCEDARISSAEGRFELAFAGKRLYLRAANHDEAEDWVDRIIEAVNKCRPVSRVDEHWEVLEASTENGVDEQALTSPSSAPSSPERGSSNDMGPCGEAPPQQEFDWTRTAELETDALKESVLYLSTDSEACTWVPLVFSLSLEALKGFRVQDGRKMLRQTHLIEEIRDVVPEVSLGGPSFFKLLTVKETIRLRAENPEEARSWRSLIRGALESYLESGDDGVAQEDPAMGRLGVNGNLHRLVQYSLKEDGALLSHLCTVPSEKGLDTQNFKCAGCPQPIGPSLGRAKLCEFSGQYYCESCHSGYTTIIPSRMVHNWDVAQREVSNKALQLLAQVEHEPLLNLEQLNPELVRHAESMAQSHNLRQRLRLLGDYLLTCRSGAYKTLQARMQKRTYLLESSHLYSVMDLRQIADGQYSTYLLTLLHFASSHVFQCDLCMQRGFFCQICHSNDIIFPFQFDITTRCKTCKAVFHRTCKATGTPCPRCQRMRKYQERDLQD